MTTLHGQPIPGWRTMSHAERRNVKMERIFHDAKVRGHETLRPALTPADSGTIEDETK